MSGRTKIGPRRKYSEEQLAVFARYRDNRATCQPRECNGGPDCWVENGPPRISPHGHCIGCHGLPRIAPEDELASRGGGRWR